MSAAPREVAVASAAGAGNAGVGAVPHVDWAAILAGALLASAIAFVFVTFGSGLGLSAIDPTDREGTSLALVAITVGLWTAWVVVSAFLAGGYLAGRLRRPAHDATPHEVEMRDGSHGLVVWALGVLIAGTLAASGIGGAAGAAASAASSAASSVASGTASAVEGAAGAVPNPMDYVTDTLLRSGEGADPTSDPAAIRDEIGRILARSVRDGELAQPDRDYLATLIARQTGVSPDEAEARIDDAVQGARQAADEAKQAADTARKAGIVLSFITAALLVVSAAAAWWAATMGGRHRDEGTDFSRITRWN